jgi:hypothetical protein
MPRVAADASKTKERKGKKEKKEGTLLVISRFYNEKREAAANAKIFPHSRSFGRRARPVKEI